MVGSIQCADVARLRLMGSMLDLSQESLNVYALLLKGVLGQLPCPACCLNR